MKNLNNRAPTIHSRFWLLALNIFMVIMISSCSSSSDSPPAFTPQNTLDGKILVLGSRVHETSNDLEIYVTGTDLNGDPLTVAQLEGVTVNVGVDSYVIADPELTVATVTGGGENILSLSLVTDWSNSTNGELAFVEGIFKQFLDKLPPLVYEAQVVTFSDEHKIQEDWSTNLTDLKTAVGAIHDPRNRTALYDSMGAALEGGTDLDSLVHDGVTDQCRPAHVMVVFTDGDDNESSGYTDTGLASIANLDKTVVIMLGTSDAKADVLTTLAGDYGAVVQVVDPSGLPIEVANWALSLSEMVKITLDQAVDVTGKAVSISLGSQTAEANPNTHCF